MKKTALVLLVALCLAAPAWAGFKEGLNAYKRGDYATALREWKPLAEAGNLSAQHNLAVMYVTGHGVPKNDQQAVYWFRKSAERGNLKSQVSMGISYNQGRGVPQDYSQAAFWFRKAAERGNALAQNSLGVLYGKGQGVPKDLVAAYMWFSLAANGGSKPAPKNRDIIAKRLTPQQLAEAQRLAREWKPKR
jgi:uncharacterized protein